MRQHLKALAAARRLTTCCRQIISNGWVRYYWTGLILQHVAQTAYLFIAVRWTFHRCVPSEADV